MASSETFGIEKGSGKRVVEWINGQAGNSKFEARLYGYTISTANFGQYEMFSWIGDVQTARKLIVRASKRFKVKVIEGGYKPKEKVFRMKKFDYARVKSGEKTIGQIEFSAPRWGNKHWEIDGEERH